MWLCHSDAFVKFGQFPGLELPRAPGHEVAGIVDALGEGVEPPQGLGLQVEVLGQCADVRRSLQAVLASAQDF